MEKVNFLRIGRQQLALAIAFVALNIVDAVLTRTLWLAGGYELNPMMRHILGWGLDSAFWLFKLGATLAVTILLLLLASKFPRPIHRIFIALVIAMVGICLFNLGGLLWV